MQVATANDWHELVDAIEKIGVHDHLCLIYDTPEEQFAAVIPYIRIGLDRGEKCIYIVDDNTAAIVIAEMKAAGIAVDTAIAAGQLAVISKQDAYLKQGYFEPEWMIGFLERSTAEAKAAGFTALRATGEMTWMLGGDPGCERLMEYEAKLNYFIPDHDVLAICQYNRKRFAPGLIKDVIATHPLVIYGGLVCRNFYYVPPDDFLEGEQTDKEIDRLLSNIVNREKVEESLRASEQRMRLFFERQLVGMAITSPQKSWIEVNDKTCQIFGYTREELASLTWDKITYPEDLPADITQFERLIRGETDNYMLEKRFVRKDGGLVFVNLAVGCVRRRDGSVDYLLALMEDITERKRAEESIQNLNKELRLMLDAAEAANKAKSQFLAAMSHELRTPLNAILGFSNMMRRDPHLNPSQRENLDIVSRSGEHLLSLINNVLEMAKIESGRLQLEMTPFDLGELVRNVGDMIRPLAQAKGLQLLIEQAGELPRYIHSDEARLRQILLHLLGNAVKFTTEGGVTMRLRFAQSTPPSLRIEIEDTGPGIAPEDQRRLFEPFVQFGEANACSGTGLGLAISHRFVQLMGGRIQVESTPGKGTLFCVTLPVEVARAGEVAELANHTKILGIAGDPSRYRILICEERRDSQLLSELMSELGLDVRHANDAEQCLKLFQDWHPHLIWMDSLETARRIRQLPEGRSVGIVAVIEVQRQDLLDAGIDAVVCKPYKKDQIHECLARQLGLNYVYQQTEIAEPAPLTPAMLATLPTALREQLREALRHLDTDRIAAIIGQIGETDAVLSHALSRLADEFDYPAILNALE